MIKINKIPLLDREFFHETIQVIKETVKRSSSIMRMDYCLLVLLSIAAIESVRASADPTNKECPLWTGLKNGSCKCGSSAFGLVQCEDERGALAVTNCYCMTAGQNDSIPLVGACLYACEPFANSSRYLLEVNTTQDLDNAMCGPYKRTGMLCGECIEGYGLPVYSYSLSCVECSHYKYNWLKYIAVAYIPLTVFCIAMVVFRVSVTSAMMAAYVGMCQLLSIRGTVMLAMKFPNIEASLNVMSFFAIWNLDFFRSLYTPFCLYPKLSALHVFMLDYAVALYPLTMIVLTYVVVELHDRFRLVVWLCKPLTACCFYFRKEWSIRNSLVQAIATFYVLSYVKVLSTSLTILSPLQVIQLDATSIEHFLYYPTLTYFGKDHRPYALLALFFTALFGAVPLFLLCLYPCRCFHMCLNKTGCRWHTLHVYMDAILGEFSHAPRDRRFFRVVYMLMRIFHLAISLLNPAAFFPAASYIIVIVIVLVTILQPYKNKWRNTVDVVLFSAVLNCYLMIIFSQEAKHSDPRTSNIQIILYTMSFYASLVILILYGIIVIFVIILPQKVTQKFQTWAAKIGRKKNHLEVEESLPHRIGQGERGALLQQVKNS